MGWRRSKLSHVDLRTLGRACVGRCGLRTARVVVSPRQTCRRDRISEEIRSELARVVEEGQRGELAVKPAGPMLLSVQKAIDERLALLQQLENTVPTDSADAAIRRRSRPPALKS